MVALTEKAVDVVRQLIARTGDGVTGMRVMVEQGGCSGLQYFLGLEKGPGAGDEIYDFGGVKVFVDPESLPIIDGMRIDFVESLDKSGFIFENPNVRDICSCGKSFAG
jgi:iron-sulfur cluster assembly protein